jgi:hypothetical protein
MPSSRGWFWLVAVVASPLACAAPQPQPQQQPTTPIQPSAALLEFLGDWSPEERALLNMNKQADKTPDSPAPEARGERRAP